MNIHYLWNKVFSFNNNDDDNNPMIIIQNIDFINNTAKNDSGGAICIINSNSKQSDYLTIKLDTVLILYYVNTGNTNPVRKS